MILFSPSTVGEAVWLFGSDEMIKAVVLHSKDPLKAPLSAISEIRFKFFSF
jgi:hypothetical protein